MAGPEQPSLADRGLGRSVEGREGLKIRSTGLHGSARSFRTKLEGVGGRFGEYCIELLCISGCNQYADAIFTRRIAKMSKSNHDRPPLSGVMTQRAADHLGPIS